MKSSALILTVILLISIALFMKCTPEASEASPAQTVKEPAGEPANPATLVERGAYLVNGIGCDDCHSPHIMGPQGPEIAPGLRLSGHQAGEALATLKDPAILSDYALFSHSATAAIGPWGTSFAGNLTPHESGIGSWTEAQFLKCIKEGKLKGLDNTRELLPPMPWRVYKNLSDDDLKAIFAYLKTLTPVDNVVPEPIPPAG